MRNYYFGLSWEGRSKFHVGASRKFCEGFAKFSVLKLHEAEARGAICRLDTTMSDAPVQCRFVVPTDSLFVQALGWRNQLVGTVMKIERIDLHPESRRRMIEILLASREEQRPSKASAE
jgi:hypothetical protein